MIKIKFIRKRKKNQNFQVGWKFEIALILITTDKTDKKYQTDKKWKIQIPASEFVPNDIRKKCDNYITYQQADKNWIRYQLITFVRQRSAIRTYIKFLFRATRDLGLFNETEAIAVSDKIFLSVITEEFFSDARHVLGNR